MRRERSLPEELKGIPAPLLPGRSKPSGGAAGLPTYLTRCMGPGHTAKVREAEQAHFNHTID